MRSLSVILALILLASCAVIPEGADPVKFRIAEAQTNLETVEALVPVAGFPAADVVAFNQFSMKAHAFIDRLKKAVVDSKDINALIDSGLVELQEYASEEMEEGQAKLNALRIVAVMRLSLMLQDQDNRIGEIMKEMENAP